MPDITGENRDDVGRFVAGTSGNPDGRPKGSFSITGEIKTKLQEIPKGEKKTYLQLLIEQVVEKALAGDSQMIRQIWEHIDGRPQQTMELNSAKFEPMIIQIREAKSLKPILF